MIHVELDEALKKIGKSRYWLADETDISASTLSNMQNGKTKGIQFETLTKICRAIGCEPGDILKLVQK